MNAPIITAPDIGRALDCALKEEKRLVVLYGDAGVGKSFGVQAWLKSRQGLQYTHTHDFSQYVSFGRSVRRGLGIEEAIPSAPWRAENFLRGYFKREPPLVARFAANSIGRSKRAGRPCIFSGR